MTVHNPPETLSFFLRWIPVVGLSLGLIFLTSIWWIDLKPLNFSLSSTAIKYFFSLIEPAIYVLSGSLALFGLDITVKRWSQAERQFQLYYKNFQRARYYDKKDEFIKYINQRLEKKDIFESYSFKLHFNVYTLHNSLFPIDNGDNLAEEHYDLLVTVNTIFTYLYYIAGAANGSLNYGKNEPDIENAYSELECHIKNWHIKMTSTDFAQSDREEQITNREMLSVLKDELTLIHFILYFEGKRNFDMNSAIEKINNAYDAINERNLLDRWSSYLVDYLRPNNGKNLEFLNLEIAQRNNGKFYYSIENIESDAFSSYLDAAREGNHEVVTTEWETGLREL